MHGLDRSKVEDILESIFVVYYAQTELRQRKIHQISFRQIKENIEWFGEFIRYYNDEKQIRSDDLLSIKFIRDNVVLDFAINTLRNLFIHSTKIPIEVVFSYFSLLKAIEIESEKGWMNFKYRQNLNIKRQSKMTDSRPTAAAGSRRRLPGPTYLRGLTGSDISRIQN